MLLYLKNKNMKKITKEEYLKNCNDKLGNKYEYIDVIRNVIRAVTKISIVVL